MQPGRTSWTQSRLAVWLAAVLFPPLGLLLVWKRPGLRVVTRLLATLGIAVLAVVHLVAFWNLRIQMDGTGMRPMFVFEDVEGHFAKIDSDRAKDHETGAAIPAPPVVESLAAAEGSPAAAAVTAYWTNFRGPNRDGRYDEMAILTEWPSDGLRELWRKPVGGGFASFSIAGGMAFTIEQRRDEEVVAAYDVETGREVWTNSWKALLRDSMGGPGPRATPTWHDGRLYVLGGEGELRCLDARTGAVIWRKNILTDNGAANTQWGMAGSPLVVDGKVIVQPGGRNGKSVVAYDALTGQPVWRSLDDEQAYTSPMTATLAGRRQLIVVSAERIRGVAIEDGRGLWDYPWRTEYNVNAAQPVVIDADRVFISAGYGHGATMLEITQDGDSFQARKVWESIRMKTKFNGAVFHEGYLYGLDEGILACVDASTGELKWKGGRYGYGQVLLASGHLLITTEDGDVLLVKATPESHQEVARFQALDGRTWNNPALAEGKLLVRNEREMAAYQIGK